MPSPPSPGVPVPAPDKPWGDGDGGWFWLGHKPGRTSKSGKSKSSKKKYYWTGSQDDDNEKSDGDNSHEVPIYWGSGGKAGETNGPNVAPSKCTKSAKSSGKSSKAVIDHGTRCLQATMKPSNNERYPDVDGYIEVCFDGQLSETSGRLVMQVDNLKADTRGGVHIHSG